MFWRRIWEDVYVIIDTYFCSYLVHWRIVCLKAERKHSSIERLTSTFRTLHSSQQRQLIALDFSTPPFANTCFLAVYTLRSEWLSVHSKRTFYLKASWFAPIFLFILFSLQSQLWRLNFNSLSKSTLQSSNMLIWI